MTEFYYLAYAAGNPMQVSIQKIEKDADIATPVAITRLYPEFPVARDMHFSPRGQYLAICNISGSYPDKKRMTVFRRGGQDDFVELDSNNLIYPASAGNITGNIQDVRFSPNGKFLAAVGSTASMFSFTIFSIDKETDIFTAVTNFLTGQCFAVDWSNDSKFIYVATSTAPHIRVFAVDDDGVATEKTGLVSSQPSYQPTALRLSPDGKTLAVSSNNTAAYVEVYKVNKDTGALTKSTNPENTDAIPQDLGWQANLRLLASVNDADYTVNLYRRAGSLFHKGPLLDRPTDVGAGAMSVAGAPDGSKIALAMNNSNNRLWVFDYDPSLETFTYNPDIVSDIAENHQCVEFSNMLNTEAVGSQILLYSDAIYDLLNETVDLANLKICLLNGTPVFNAGHTTFTQVVGANEVYKTGWAQGGVAIPNVQFESGAGNSLVLTFPEINAAYGGSEVLEFRSALIYDATHADKKPLAFIKFIEVQVAKQFDEIRFNLEGGVLVQFTPE